MSHKNTKWEIKLRIKNQLNYYYTEIWEAHIKYSNCTLNLLYTTVNKIMSLFQH